MLLPGAILDPGAHWNYEAGQSSCLMDVWHYTVGSNSIALIRDNGLCGFLIRDEGIYQFGPDDAVYFTQCEWNRVAMATEVESLDGSISEAKLGHLRYLTLWKLTTRGIPEIFYDGPRLPIGTPYRGVTNHRDLVHIACDQHYDGFDQWVWDAVTAPPPPPRPGDTMASFLIVQVGGADNGKVFVYDADANTKSWIHNGAALDGHVQARNIIKYTGGWADSDIHRTDEPDRPWAGLLADARDLDAQDDVAVGGASTGGGATPAEVLAIVATDGAKTRADVNRARTLT